MVSDLIQRSLISNIVDDLILRLKSIIKFIPEYAYELLQYFINPQLSRRFTDNLLSAYENKTRQFTSEMVSSLMNIVISYNNFELDESITQVSPVQGEIQDNP